MLPVVCSYNFDAEVKKYEEKKEKGFLKTQDENIVSYYSIIQKNDFSPQLRFENEEMHIFLQKKIDVYWRILFESLIGPHSIKKEVGV